MSNIDWSKAPEGATHWDVGSECVTPGWMRLNNGTWHWWPVESSALDKTWYVCPVMANSRLANFTPRPAEEWTGEGLPPVGTVCERNISRSAWCQTTILAVTPEGKNVAYQDMAGQLGWSGCESHFRPILTPEQIAAEERDKAVREMQGLGGIQRQSAEWIYDAGYRKVTP